MANRIQLRRGTAAEWAAKNPILAPGEPGVETDTGQEKFGDGVTPWNARPYAKPGEPGIAGKDGSNVLPTDTAIRQAIEDPASETSTALSATFAGKVDLSDAGYDVVLLVGQSNMQGDSSGTVSSVVDIADPRIWTYGATGTYAGQIVQATDPLAHRGGSSVVGPGMAFARWYAGTIPGNRRVLLVPAAYNGTAFGSGTNRWDPTSAWPLGSTNLYELAITQTADALAAAGSNSRIVAALWVQGESDALNTSMDATTYRGYLEYLIDGLRQRLNAPTLPFIIGSMVPEFIAVNAVRQGIDNAHKAIPTRKPYTTYVLGPSGMQRGDNLHYSPAGNREQGKRMLKGLAAARANTQPSNVVPTNPPPARPPAVVNTVAPVVSGTATTGSTLTTTDGTWSPTPTSYTYQWRRSGANIAGATTSTYVLVTADSGQAITCRVTAIRADYTNGTADSTTVTPAAAPATVYAADSFDRADSSTSLGSTSTGALPWVPLSGTWGISGNTAYETNTDAALNRIAVVDSAAADGTITLTLNGTGVNNSGIAFRVTDASNWFVWLGSGSLYKSEAGALSAVAGFSNRTASPGDVLKLTLNGSTITGTINGAAFGSGTSTFNQTATKHGLLSKGGTARFENYEHKSS